MGKTYEEIYYEMLDDLAKGICYINTIKKDGSERIFYATRNPEIIEHYGFKFTTQKSEMEREDLKERDFFNLQIRIFDLHKKAWRSFIMDKVQKDGFVFITDDKDFELPDNPTA